MREHVQAERFVAELVERGELEVDAEGRVWRSAVRGGIKGGGSRLTAVARRRAEHRTSTGYLQVRALIDGRRYSALAHRLAWHVLRGPIPAGRCLNHVNGQKDDNRPENLEVATYSENALHASRVLGALHDQRGARNNAAKLTPEAVCEIRQRRARGEPLKSIATDHGVSDRTVSKIARGDRWAVPHGQ